jgi:importin subunit beta-1
VIVQALLATADRGDAADTHLQASAYETMNEVVRSSTDDTVQVVVQLIPVIMTKLGATLQMQILSGDDKERQSELQALLCGVLQVRRKSGG